MTINDNEVLWLAPYAPYVGACAVKAAAKHEHANNFGEQAPIDMRESLLEQGYPKIVPLPAAKRKYGKFQCCGCGDQLRVHEVPAQRRDHTLPFKV